MKDKRKEILRDLLGEFATDEESRDDSNDIFGKDTRRKRGEIEANIYRQNLRKRGFNLDKVMKRPSKRAKVC